MPQPDEAASADRLPINLRWTITRRSPTLALCDVSHRYTDDGAGGGESQALCSAGVGRVYGAS